MTPDDGRGHCEHRAVGPKRIGPVSSSTQASVIAVCNAVIVFGVWSSFYHDRPHATAEKTAQKLIQAGSVRRYTCRGVRWRTQRFHDSMITPHKYRTKML